MSELFGEEKVLAQIDLKLRDRIDAEVRRITEYYINDDKPISQVGLYSGIAGVCLFLSQAYKYYDDERIFHKINNHLDHSIELISKGNVDPSFSSGIAGWGWLLIFLEQQKLIESYELDFLDEIDSALKNSLSYFLQQGEIDQLNGAIGIGRYFLKRGDPEAIESIVSFLKDNNALQGKECAWRLGDFTNRSVKFFNYSLSHGITGILKFLLDCRSSNIVKENMDELIEGCVSFLLKGMRPIQNVGSIFPNMIEEGDYLNVNLRRKVIRNLRQSRLSWCYGDLGTFHTLAEYASTFNKSEIAEICHNGMMKNTLRKSDSQTQIVDPGFCHGSSGVAYMFYKYGIVNSNESFRETAIYWLISALNEGIKDDGIDGYKYLIGNFENRDFYSSRMLLEGTAGVALVYLSFLEPSLMKWDECMMI